MSFLKPIKTLALSLSLMVLSPATFAADKSASTTKPSFEQYIVALKQEAIAKGFEQALIDESFANVTFHKRAVKADRNQPEKVETLDTYLPKRLPEMENKACS